MSRIKSARSPTGVSLSGPLTHALPRHAEQRAKHFFLFLFALQATCDMVSARTGRQFDPLAIVREAATHQIDSGLRQNSARDPFDSTDPGVVNINGTSFSKIDAAHYCNLGLAGDFSILKTAAAADRDNAEMVELCEILAGDTVWLPQKINIGPDRVIDQLHYQLAQAFLANGRPVFTPQNVAIYAARSDADIRDFANGKDTDEPGLAACARLYLAPYANLPAAIFDSVRHDIEAECDARRLDRALYVSL
ncbi:hypothetical protein NFI95_12870 [Acetobacteraceae bacterium KSS8]|uniref:Uncharacterized protein n=1 Tax=Endosaccharibacter trunci TaxID=2812733 RepID=A0ABT1W8Y0_9PROT|nr:hypothetical protein [Acetobacteraceae bacterium KSS8]